MSTTNLGYPEIDYRPIYKVFLGLKEIPKPHTRTNADSPSFKMLQERENQGSSVHPGPHFRQAAHARLEGPKAPASRIPAAPTGVSPSPRDARAAPAPSPGVSLACRPGQALDVIQQVTGGPAFSRSRSLSGVLGAGPQILLGPDHSGGFAGTELENVQSVDFVTSLENWNADPQVFTHTRGQSLACPSG